jgi:hypothetical protein
MQATKVKGIIDDSGQLIINEPINLSPGEVEVIVLQTVKSASSLPQSSSSKRQSPSQVKALKDWFENTEPTSPDFDSEQAKWEYLKKKHNL